MTSREDILVAKDFVVAYGITGDLASINKVDLITDEDIARVEMTIRELITAALKQFESPKDAMTEHIIPEMTDPLGNYWDQPKREHIVVVGDYAYMAQATYDELANYSSSHPSGVYAGKMWKRVEPYKKLLVWYGPESNGQCSINYREIRIGQDTPHDIEPAPEGESKALTVIEPVPLTRDQLLDHYINDVSWYGNEGQRALDTLRLIKAAK